MSEENKLECEFKDGDFIFQNEDIKCIITVNYHC